MMKEPAFPHEPVRSPGGARATTFEHGTPKLANPAEIEADIDVSAVRRFAFAMEEKLALKRGQGRGGWHDKEDCSAEFLSRLLREHVEKGDPVDVANFCMMLHQRGERITS